MRRLVSGIMLTLLLTGMFPSLLNLFFVAAEASPMEWEHTYGGTNDDIAYSMIKTSDGGYALAGYTRSYGAGGADFWLVKTDSSGKPLWNKTYGGSSSEFAYSMVQTSDGGYALAGYIYVNGNYDFWLVRTDTAGNQLWNKSFGGAGKEMAYCVIQVDNGFGLVGETSSKGAGGADFWLVVTDSSGDMLFDQTWGGTSDDIAYSVVWTWNTDGGYAITGQTLNGGATVFALVKTDNVGTVSWTKYYGGLGVARSVIQTYDDGFGLAGTGAGFRFVTTDANGNMLLDRSYEAPIGTGEAYSLTLAFDGGCYALAGRTGGTPDFWLVKINSAGNALWNGTYGGSGADGARSVVRTTDGGFALAGYTYSYGAGGADFWLVKLPQWTPPPPPPDFSMVPFPTSLTIQQGSSDTSTISLSSTGGFNQLVQLVVSGAPPGVSPTLAPSEVTPSEGVWTQSTLTIYVSSSAAPGSYPLTVTGTSGSLIHSIYVTLEIPSPAHRTLTVSSAHDSPVPGNGPNIYSDGQSVTCSVSSPVTEGGTVWTCTGWTGTGSVPASGTGSSTGPFTITQDSSITWNWQGSVVQRTLTVSSAHDSPNPSNGPHTYNDGSSVTCSVSSPVVEGLVSYSCTGWSGTGSVPSSGSVTSVTFTITQDSSITWNWIVTPIYSLTITASVGGTTSPAPGTYQYENGEVATVRAWPHSGYQFSHWKLDTVNVGSVNPYSVTIGAAHTLQAVFEVFSQRPIASFVFSPCSLNPVVDEEIIFDASQSMGATFYTWDFDDGHSESTSSWWTHHQYTMPGTYNVKLTAMNFNGHAETSKTVTVKKPVVVLVHGWKPAGGWNYDEWSNMKDCLVGSGFEVYIAKYAPTDRGTSDHIKEYAAKLDTEVNFARVAYNVDKVDIVAHSMGGLVSRWYIQILGGDRYVRKLIMLETPNHGIPPYVLFAAYSLPMYWGVLQWDSVGDMTAGNSQFLQNLNRNNDGISPNVHYEILGGLWYSHTPRAWWDLDAVEVPSQNIFSKVGHGDLIKNLYVISRVIYLLIDDPEPINPKEQDLLFQFAPVISDRISPDEQDSFEILISSTSQADFIVTWSEGVLNLTLNTPSGRLIDPYIAEIDPNITYYQDDNIKCYSVQDPESGVWRANVTAVNITEEEQYMLMPLLNTTHTLSLDWQKCEYDLFESMQIRADLAYANESIVGASIDAKILKPDNATETLTLYDDGLHNDNQTNDGIYANTFMNTSLWGAYYITVTANGSLNTEQFAREAFATVWVEQYPDLSLSESDIYFSEETATEGEIITINATVHNIGEADANNASILFYDGNPANGTLIGEYTLNVISDEAEIASIQWNVTRGTHQINVQVSPYNEFLELDYANNIANRDIGATGHDMTLLTITTSKRVVAQAYEMPIDVIVENQGDFPEDFNVTLFANTTIIGKQTVDNFPNGTWTILDFTWNTTGFAYGNYVVSAYAWPVPGEIDTADNTYTYGLVSVTIVGDVDGNGNVNVLDAIDLSNSYDLKTGQAGFNPNADFDDNGIVNILDAITLSNHYNQHYP